jgi:hypothetical protein
MVIAYVTTHVDDARFDKLFLTLTTYKCFEMRTLSMMFCGMNMSMTFCNILRKEYFHDVL